jgi:hypothetical protein
MLEARELESDKGRGVWDAITAAAAGDIPTPQRLLARDPGSSQAEYWYTQPIHYFGSSSPRKTSRRAVQARASRAAAAR